MLKALQAVHFVQYSGQAFRNINSYSFIIMLQQVNYGYMQADEDTELHNDSLESI